MLKFCVVGAGAVGLSTAVQLLQNFPDTEVTLIAKQFYKDTTSYGAAGLCRPTFEKVPGVPFHIYRQWLSDSWQFYHTLAHSPDAADAGVQIVSGFEFYNEDRDTSLEKAVIYDHRDCTAKEMSLFPGQKYSNGYKATTLMTECSHFLPYLMKRFQDAGGKIEQRELHSLSELVGRGFDLVMNCTGLGSRTLVADEQLYPSRGHVFRVIAPWVKNFIYIEDGQGNYTYVYPGQDDVIIGGTKAVGNEDLTPRKKDRDSIWQRACEIMPSLKKAKLKSEWVGLRPMRKPLRLEKEVITFPNGNLTVIHNYGHGGEGVNLSWGTACHAVRLVKQHLNPAAKL